MASLLKRMAILVAIMVVLWAAGTVVWVSALDARPGLRYTVRVPNGRSQGMVHVHEAVAETASGYAWRIKVMSVSGNSAVVRLHARHSPDNSTFETMSRGLDTVAPQQFTFRSCDRLEIPVEGAPPLVLTGFTSSPCVH